jgi:uncharacterized protein YbgA (DUF1722 family)
MRAIAASTGFDFNYYTHWKILYMAQSLEDLRHLGTDIGQIGQHLVEGEVWSGTS